MTTLNVRSLTVNGSKYLTYSYVKVNGNIVTYVGAEIVVPPAFISNSTPETF